MSSSLFDLWSEFHREDSLSRCQVKYECACGTYRTLDELLVCRSASCHPSMSRLKCRSCCRVQCDSRVCYQCLRVVGRNEQKGESGCFQCWECPRCQHVLAVVSSETDRGDDCFEMICRACHWSSNRDTNLFGWTAEELFGTIFLSSKRREAFE